MYDSNRGYGAKNEDEKYVDSRGYDYQVCSRRYRV